MLTKTLEFKQPWRVQPQRKANQIIFSYLEEWKIHYQNDKNFTSWKIFYTESMMIIKICSINFQVWFKSINHLIQQWDRMWIIIKVDASTKIHNKIHNSLKHWNSEPFFRLKVFRIKIFLSLTLCERFDHKWNSFCQC